MFDWFLYRRCDLKYGGVSSFWARKLCSNVAETVLPPTKGAVWRENQFSPERW